MREVRNPKIFIKSNREFRIKKLKLNENKINTDGKRAINICLDPINIEINGNYSGIHIVDHQACSRTPVKISSSIIFLFNFRKICLQFSEIEDQKLWRKSLEFSGNKK